MKKNLFTPVDYKNFWDQAVLDPKKTDLLEKICKQALSNWSRYEQVAKIAGIPWQIIAVIHYRECDFNFSCHLHNGDPLTARTVRVPAGRPTLSGPPPFTWEESTVDLFKDLSLPERWDIPGALEFLENYNGTGYQSHGTMTPYLWNFTNLYSKGLYVADGQYDPEKIENRAGAVAILKVLAAKGVSFEVPSTSSNR